MQRHVGQVSARAAQRLVLQARHARDEGPTDAQIAAIKTRLSAKELAEYKALLLQARAELIARVTGLEDEALRSSGGNLSNMPLHMADIGTDTFDQDLAIGMAETERERRGHGQEEHGPRRGRPPG
ncbi:MAG: hypothetical protein ACKOTD_06720, partial [Phycisphaerales bacterium]